MGPLYGRGGNQSDGKPAGPWPESAAEGVRVRPGWEWWREATTKWARRKAQWQEALAQQPYSPTALQHRHLAISSLAAPPWISAPWASSVRRRHACGPTADSSHEQTTGRLAQPTPASSTCLQLLRGTHDPAPSWKGATLRNGADADVCVRLRAPPPLPRSTDPFQTVELPEHIEEYLDHGTATCTAFNRRGTLLAGTSCPPTARACMPAGVPRCCCSPCARCFHSCGTAHQFRALVAERLPPPCRCFCGCVLAAGTSNGNLVVWDFDTRGVARVYAGHE